MRKPYVTAGIWIGTVGLLLAVPATILYFLPNNTPAEGPTAEPLVNILLAFLRSIFGLIA